MMLRTIRWNVTGFAKFAAALVAITFTATFLPAGQVPASKITANGVEILRPKMTMNIAPYGEVEAFVVRSPTGAWIEFFQQK